MSTASPYIPTFPFTGPQIILTSDRIVLHSRGDSIFLFGKNAIGLSSPGRINIDTATGTTINAPEIELGLSAKQKGQPVTKADSLVDLLDQLIKDLTTTADALSHLSDTNFQQSVIDVVARASKLKGTCTQVRSKLSTVKSKTTYTL